MSSNSSSVVAVIGAGPVGLAAAAHLHKYRQPFVVLEVGAEAGAAVREWGHVRTFSPWRYMIDGAAQELLESSGWSLPNQDHLPTGDITVSVVRTGAVFERRFKPGLIGSYTGPMKASGKFFHFAEQSITSSLIENTWASANNGGS